MLQTAWRITVFLVSLHAIDEPALVNSQYCLRAILTGYFQDMLVPVRNIH